jgi:DNA-binding NarL/FixJ family response regulator
VLIVDQGSTPVPIPEYLQTLKLRFPNGKFLIAGERCVREELCRLLILGAQGFVAYEDLKKSLAPAVDALWAGGLWVSPAAVKSLAEKRVEGISARAGDCMAGLTPRERQVAELLQQRLCNKEISARLNVSVATVKFHLENIFNKFGVHDRHSVVDSAAQDRAHGRVAG